MTLQGTITRILPTELGQAKNGRQWNKQGYIVEYGEGNYPKQVAVYLWGELAANNPLSLGEEVTLEINLESREYNNRWYTEVKCWRITERKTSAQSAVLSHQQLPTSQAPSTDLPF